MSHSPATVRVSFFEALTSIFTPFPVFTIEHRRQLSNVAEVHQPFVSHSPMSSISGHSSRQESGTPDLVLGQGSRAALQRPSLVSTNVEFGELANQFGVEPRLVEALAQKLSAMC